MIDHVSIAVADLAASAAFYEAVLEPLGLKIFVTRENTVGFGKKYPEFWLNARPGIPIVAKTSGHHVCLRAPTRESVRAFHEAALAHGGSDAGPPGERNAEVTTYFGAFIFDLDGNKIEVANFPKAESG